MKKTKLNNRFDACTTTDDGELINREDVWHFYAYFAREAAGILHEFLDICDLPDDSHIRIWTLQDTPPSESVGQEGFDAVMDALGMLIDYFDKGGLVLNGQEINLEWGDPVRSLTEGLHLFINVLPYLNQWHYDLSRERYDEEKYHRYSFEELQHLDQTLAIRILPTFTWFADHSIFTPKYFERMYDYPKPMNHKSTMSSCFGYWHEALGSMLKSWQWLRDRKPNNQKVKWEDIPDEIYYGLHLFAEYLPEMQND